MVIVTATKEFTFDMAHMLANHEGLCRNVHGHTYKILVTVSRNDFTLIDDGPSEGMIIDFKDLKYVVQEALNYYDHSLMLNIQSDSLLEKQLQILMKDSGQKVAWVNYRPTAENMAKSLYECLNNRLNRLGVHVDKIRLYETPTSYVEVFDKEDV